MPKGHKTAKVLSKEQAREALRLQILEHQDEMTAAQIESAKGISYLMTREPSGKFVKVTAAMAGALQGTEIIEVWEEKPNTQAYTDLMNRALDKPKEQEQAIDANVTHRFLWGTTEE